MPQIEALALLEDTVGRVRCTTERMPHSVELDTTRRKSPPPSLWWRAFLFTELVLLYIAVPSTIWWLHRLKSRPPLIPILIVIGLISLLVLIRRHPRTLAEVLRWRGARGEVRRIFTLFGCAAVLLSIYTSIAKPELLLALPRERPWVWLAIVVLYPILSVIPQELVFRVFLFRRYRAILPSRAARVVVSAVLFGFAHVIYGNAYSVALSTVGGVIFALTYLRTRSIWIVSLEHALYGLFLFTIGLGVYFH